MPNKHLLCLALSCAIIFPLFAQQLYVAPGTDLSIMPGTNFSLDSLVLKPSETFILNGNTISKQTSVENPIGKTYISRVYHFSNPTAAFTGEVIFGYADSQLNGLQEEDLRVHQFDGSAWLPYATGYANNTINNTVAADGFNATVLKEFTLSNSTVLPLRWMGVQALRLSKQVKIQWQTAAELQVSSFSVQRSMDGIEWTTVASNIFPQQNATSGNYFILDNYSNSGRIFYRIKQYSTSGAFNYSAVVTVKAIGTATNIMLYPNPVTTHFKILNLNADGLKEIKLLDITGKLVKSWPKVVPVYDIDHLPAGIYQLLFIYSTSTINFSIIKQ